MKPSYDTLIVTFSNPIKILDGIFEDAAEWGASTLKEWIDTYESTRMTPIDEYTAVITSEYNMEYVKEWLQRYTPVAEITEF